jgi:hypothetical protein
MGTVNLDAARKARREQKKEGPKVTFGRKTWELAPSLPYAVLEQLPRLQQEDENSLEALSEITKAILGKHYDEFMAKEPDLEDVNADSASENGSTPKEVEA